MFAAELVCQLFVFAIEQLVAPEVVDGAMLCGGHQPGAGIPWDARFGPLLERGDQRILRQILGHADIPDDACEPGNETGRFDPPDGIDRAMSLGNHNLVI
jgi:hypothetical protein